MEASLQAIRRPPIADFRDYAHKQYDDISSTGYGHKSLLIAVVKVVL